ncbi:MAG: hypothetical protein HQL98_08845 [Magnetococcales bacterium]|nr:hypothetical protein [Magnetococcales bacterium]
MEPHEFSKESQQLLASGNAQGCIEQITREVAADRASIPQLLARAIAHMWLSHYPESLADCEAVMRIDPDNRQLYFIRGAVFRRMNRLDDAVANLTQAIDVHPEYGIAFLERAYCYTAMGHSMAAERDLQTALMLIEAALQGFCDSMGVMRTQMDATESLMNGERDYPRLFLSPAEIENLKRTLH